MDLMLQRKPRKPDFRAELTSGSPVSVLRFKMYLNASEKERLQAYLFALRSGDLKLFPNAFLEFSKSNN